MVPTSPFSRTIVSLLFDKNQLIHQEAVVVSRLPHHTHELVGHLLLRAPIPAHLPQIVVHSFEESITERRATSSFKRGVLGAAAVEDACVIVRTRGRRRTAAGRQ
jgi:hypothetical protein